MSGPDELAEAERVMRALAQSYASMRSMEREADAFAALLAEYDRRGQIEQRARDMIESPGRYDENDVSVARYIVTGKTS